MGCGDEGDCRETLEQIYEYLDGELDAAHLAAVRDHLEHCPHCNQQLGLEVQVRSLIVRSCTCFHAPDELRHRILTTIASLRASSPFFTGGTMSPRTFLTPDRPSEGGRSPLA